MVVTNLSPSSRKVSPDNRMQVRVNVQAEVIDPELARRRANVWLLDNAGNLLAAVAPELILGEQLLWRFDVILGLPDLAQPGRGHTRRIGQIAVDAASGEVQAAPHLAADLQSYAAETAG